jgi:parvulin-like peptidyl-prolyl isomerase
MKTNSMKNYTIANLIFLPVCLFTVVFCSKQEVTDETIVVEVGDRIVTARDFRISYELAPPGEMKKTGDAFSQKKDYLQKIVEKKLLTIAGLEKNLDNDENVQKLLRWYEKEEVIRQLYREIVSEQVLVSDKEVRDADVLLNQRLFLRQLLFKSESEANKIYERLQNGETFEKIALEMADSEEELQHILTPREFRWGELDEYLETTAYGLNLLETTVPIKSDVGYHIVQLVNRKENLILTESGYAARHHYVETIIRRRKEAQLAKEYVKSLLADKRLKANGPVLLKLTERAKAILREKKLESPVPPFAQARLIRSYLPDMMSETLLVFEGGEWSVGEFFDRLEQMPPQSRPDLTNPGRLQVDLAIMFRDEFLAKEGYNRQLEQSEAVRKEVNRIREEVVAERMRRSLLDTVQVSDKEIQIFFTKNIDWYRKPEMVNIQEIMVYDKNLADSLYRLIQNGKDIGKLATKYSERKWAAKRGGELGYFSKEAFGTVGKRAFEMKVGELTEPVPVKIDTFIVGYSIFRVIGRKPLVTPKLQDEYNKVAQDALTSKKQLVLERFLDGIKKHHPVKLNEGILAEIKTSDELGTGRPMDLIKIIRR